MTAPHQFLPPSAIGGSDNAGFLLPSQSDAGAPTSVAGSSRLQQNGGAGRPQSPQAPQAPARQLPQRGFERPNLNPQSFYGISGGPARLARRLTY